MFSTSIALLFNSLLACQPTSIYFTFPWFSPCIWSLLIEPLWLIAISLGLNVLHYLAIRFCILLFVLCMWFSLLCSYWQLAQGIFFNSQPGLKMVNFRVVCHFSGNFPNWESSTKTNLGFNKTQYNPKNGIILNQHYPNYGIILNQHYPNYGIILTQYNPKDGIILAQHYHKDGILLTQHNPKNGIILTQHNPKDGSILTQYNPKKWDYTDPALSQLWDYTDPI